MQSQLVVIVDDHITNLKILDRLAASLGAGTLARTFTDPHAALGFAAEECPDLVVIGSERPGLDTGAFIARLRAQPGGADTAVLVITGDDDREERRKALDAGADDYLPGPVDHREFQMRAGNLLLLRRQRRLLQIATLPAAAPPQGEASRRRSAVERRLMRVINAVPAMIAATDRDGRYTIVNDRFSAFLGMRPDGLIGKRPAEARDDAFSRELSERDARLIAGTAEPGSFEEMVEGEGEPRWLLTSKSAFRGGEGEEPMVVTVSLDITERRNAERDLVVAKELAEIANRSKTEFLANMSHELRTPLNAIIGFSQVMAGEMLGPIATRKYVGYAKDVAASAEHLLGIINDILDVSKLESGKLDLIEEPVDLVRAVRDLLRLVEQKARAGEVRLEPRFERDLPRLNGDARKIKQILLNLLTNAIKFSPPGGTVEIVARTEAGAVTLSIADRGIGMDAAEVEVAVSRFGQVASAWSRREPGTGLGLPLAIGLTELHGGRLAIDSRKGLGTTVTVSFPPERTVRAVPAPAALKAVGGA